jgi:hypothetical protein
MGDLNEMPHYYYGSCAKSFYDDQLDFQKVINTPLPQVDIAEYGIP